MQQTPRLGTKDAVASLHAVPPLSEQKAIVVRVDELMALCDELEEKQQRKATVTTKLRGSAFNALRQAETPDDLSVAWERISTNWAHLTNHPDSIPELRQTILGLAVKGELDRRIDTSGSRFSCDPFESMPLGLVGKWGSGGTPQKSRTDYYNGGIPWLVIGDLNDGLVATSKSSVTELAVAESSAKMIPVGSVLIAMYGASIGKTGITAVECCTNQAIAHCIPDPDVVRPDFLVLLLQSLKSTFIDMGRGAAQPNVSQTIIKAFEVSVPCIKDQSVIVSTFGSMMAMCDELEKQLLHQQDLSSRLAIAATRLAG